MRPKKEAKNSTTHTVGTVPPPVQPAFGIAINQQHCHIMSGYEMEMEHGTDGPTNPANLFSHHQKPPQKSERGFNCAAAEREIRNDMEGINQKQLAAVHLVVVVLVLVGWDRVGWFLFSLCVQMRS